MSSIATYNQEMLAEPAFLAGIRLRARRRTLWLRHLWSTGQAEMEQGMTISHSEVDRILDDPAAQNAAEAAFYETDPLAQRLSEEIREADRQASLDMRLHRLCRAFELSAQERDLLVLTVAVEADPALRRVYGYLQDDVTACYPTPWLASTLFGWPPGIYLHAEAPLVRWRLARPMEGTANPWSLNTPWVADPYTVACLMNGECLDPTLGSAVSLVAAIRSESFCLYPEALASMQTYVQAMWQEVDRAHAAPPAIEIALIGPEGAGKRTLAAQFCAGLGADMLVADAGQLLDPEAGVPQAIERAMCVARMARLLGAVLYWNDADSMDLKVRRALYGQVGLTLLGVGAPPARHNRPGVVHRSFPLPTLSQAQRIALWAHLSDRPVPDPIATWILMPAEIANAAIAAPAGPDAIDEACRKSLQRDSGKLLALLRCPYTWEDLVLSSTVERALKELETQALLRWPVYEEWGFERLCPMGRGITALFAGPSGTGKTMAAQVLARSLGMELCRVDLASVMSKYIGETEKNLKQIFDLCERANVLLFFDEADALFGQRTQVKDAHDRFANVEIDYLLQRMEQFDGIAVLATNRRGDIDSAFLRRFRFIIDFMLPGPAERLRLWHLALTPQAPDGQELLDRMDWEFLANNLELTGADIKACALSAAFLARAAGTRIQMQQLLHAVRREMAKRGVVLRAGDWEGYQNGASKHRPADAHAARGNRA